MDNNIELLNYIYINSSGKINYISQFVDIVEDKKFHKLLTGQIKEYSKISKKAEQELNALNCDLPTKSVSSIISSLSAIASTLVDKSSSHISEIMIDNKMSNVVEIIKKKNEHKDADTSTLSLADELLNAEENNIIQLKKFLC